MTTATRICLIGFGEVGQTLADDLARAASADLIAWDIQFAKPNSNPSVAVQSRAVRVATDAASAVRGTQLVISAVTAAQDADAARSVLAGLEPGTFYFDLNSVSPEMKREVASIVDATGARYVEGAVMSPIGPKRIASPILLGGPHAEEFSHLARELGFTGAQVFAREVGKASAAKMCRSVMIKGVEALLTESLLAARKHGVEDTVLVSLKDLLPGVEWRKLAQYMISRSLIHGKRRAEEMREVAHTVANTGLTPHMSAACAERQEWAARFREFADASTLEEMLDRILTSPWGEVARSAGEGTSAERGCNAAEPRPLTLPSPQGEGV